MFTRTELLNVFLPVCFAVILVTKEDVFGVARLYSTTCLRSLPNPNMADCDNGGVCEEVKCENGSVCYLGYNKEQNVRYRGCMLRDRCTILENNTMDQAYACRETKSVNFNETQCLFCCSNRDNCNQDMVNSDQWPVPAVIVITEPPPVPPEPVPFDLVPVLAGAGGVLFVLIVVIIVVCFFVVRARRRRKNLALLVRSLERFKTRQANRSVMDKGLDTLTKSLGFGRKNSTFDTDTLKE